MKLDKTLEEITTYNKSLNNTTGEVAEEYFKLRLSNDKQISQLKIVHNSIKIKEKLIITQLNLISIKRIDYFIKNSKNNVKEESDIQSTAVYAFTKMLEDFDYNNSIYYENNRDKIINYMIQMYKLKLEMSDLNIKLRTTVTQFIEINNIKSHTLAAMVTLYQDIKRGLKVYSDFNNIDEYKKYHSIKEEISTFAEKVFLEEVENVINKKLLDKMCADNMNKKELAHNLTSAKYYAPSDSKIKKDNTNTTISKKQIEIEMTNIIMGSSDLSRLAEEYNKPIEPTPKKKPKPKKRKLNKEEREIDIKNKENTDIALKQMGFII